MRPLHTPLALTISLALPLLGCMELRHTDDAGTTCTPQDQSTTPADLSPAAPKCAAAKGLPGDNVLCVDFDKVSQLTDPALAGWNFNAPTSAGCMGWQISGGKLQVKMYSALNTYCGITMPAFDLKLPSNQNYLNAVISILHTVDVVEGQQQAKIYAGAVGAGRQLVSLTGKNSRSTNILSISKSDIPTIVNNVFQPVLLLDSGVMAGGTAQGWNIESIAINLSP